MWWERAKARGLNGRSIFIALLLTLETQPGLAGSTSHRLSPDFPHRGSLLATQAIEAATQLLRTAAGVSLPSVEVVFDSEEGCNAFWDGSRLLLLAGNAHCRPAAEVPDLVLHEFGHRVTQHLLRRSSFDQATGEALADLFAAIFSSDSKIAEGFYTDRSIHWLRDLADRRHYPEQARGVYSESMILSTGLYPLIRALSREDAIRFWVLFHERYTEIPDRGLTRSATAAYVAANSLLSPGHTCLLYRSLLQNGLEPQVTRPACSAAAIPLHASFLRTATGWRFDVHSLPPGSSRTRAILSKNGGREHASAWSEGTRFEVPLTTQCGDRIDYRIEAQDSRGVVLGEFLGTTWHGQTSEPQSVVFPLLSAPRPIPDGTGALRFSFEHSASPGHFITQATLLFDVDHPYADDLYLAFAENGVPLTDFLRGHEEVDFPGRVELPAPSPRDELQFEASLRDSTRGSAGILRSAAVELQTVQFDCR